MNVLVTGGGGFIGSALVRRLVAAGDSVCCLDLKLPESERRIAGAKYLEGDFADARVTTGALQGVDVVFHLAWSTIPATSNVNPCADLSSNLIGTIQFLEACKSVGVDRFVFSSSGGTIYGDTCAEYAAEDTVTEPMCSYGVSKLAAEKYLAIYSRTKRIKCVSLRISNAYGPGQDPASKVGFICAALDAITNSQPITIWGTGEAVRDYVFISDIIAAFMLAAKPDFPSGVYNVSSGKGISLNSLIPIISEVTKSKLKVIYEPGREFDVRHIVLDNKRIASKGWSPKFNLHEGISATWEWMNSRGSADGKVSNAWE